MLKYLIKKRKKPKFFSYFWFKFWAKRILHIPGVFLICKNRMILILKRCELGDTSVLFSIPNGRCNNLKIGEQTYIGRNVYLGLHEKLVIEDNVVINDGVKIFTASHAVDSFCWSSISKPVTIKKYAWIATSAILLPGVTIGKGAVVAAGAVVSKNVEDYEVVAGNPAKKINIRSNILNYDPTCFCASIEAWIGNK